MLRRCFDFPADTKNEVILNYALQQLKEVKTPKGNSNDSESRDKAFISQIQQIIGCRDYGLIIKTIEKYAGSYTA
jgi:hypothetical protein